jgi:hypothetical protein
MRCSLEQCPIYKVCTDRRHNPRLLPCLPIHEAADNMRPATEEPLRDDMYDPPATTHYLDVINELAAGVERMRSLPPRILLPALWRRLIIRAMSEAQVPETIIAKTLHICERTVRRESRQLLP